MSRFLRSAIATVMNATCASSMVRRARRDALVVVCYHRVLPATERAASPFPDLAVTPEAFDEQVALFAKHYECVTLRDAVERLQRGEKRSRPLLAITFDDGYWDNHAHALPVLEKHNARATFFVVSSLIGTTEQIWCDQLARTADYLTEQNVQPSEWIGEQNADLHSWLTQLSNIPAERPGAELVRSAKSLSPSTRCELLSAAVSRATRAGFEDNGTDHLMTVEQLRDLAAHGHEVASHTCTHPILPLLPADELAHEMMDSKSSLERILGKDVVSIAYPNGDFDEAVEQAARDACYLNAATTRTGLNHKGTNRLELRRVFISQDRLSNSAGRCATNVLQLELNGMADLLFLRKWRSNG